MKLSELSIQSLVPFITGDNSPSPDKSGPEIIKFFNLFGINDEYSFQNGGLPESLSRRQYTEKTLKSLNDTYSLKTLIETLVDSRNVNNEDEIATAINQILKHDNQFLEKNAENIYKVIGKGIDDNISIYAHFDEIKVEILQHIQNAQLCIWVAMAWFTDKDLANELLKQHHSGLNIQVLVNNDETTQKYGLDFSSKGIEYYTFSPKSIFGKKIMHNKFCIIDMKKTIHGSYNWTNNAIYNNENITISESRELAEGFARQFIQLKLEAKKSSKLRGK